MNIRKDKKDLIRRFYIHGTTDLKHMVRLTGLKRVTISYYLEEFRKIEKQYPEKLHDFDFHLNVRNVKRPHPRHQELMELLPKLVLAETDLVLVGNEIYRKYLKVSKDPYSLPRFSHFFRRWFLEHSAWLNGEKAKLKYTPEELKTLEEWRRGNDHRRWQIAVVLLTGYTYHSLMEVQHKVETTRCTIYHWRKTYEREGLSGFDKKIVSAETRKHIEEKMDNLVFLVRQSPKDYGINRTGWKLEDLAAVFSKEYEPITYSCVSVYLKRRGIRYRRSREVITSTDPKFKEKYGAIQHQLETLGPKEKFFSIDEYGPCAVRQKGGTMLTLPGEMPTFKGMQKSKGWFICTCALELSTNQITHFYSTKKNTEEMIKLAEVLMAQYHDQDKLYLSWDAASWHESKQLKAYIKEHNESERVPKLQIMPLPARNPHLNVIESVFSGMSKAIIRNSDYESLGECKAAMDRYFADRNKHYLENPHRAGNKIWGKERVLPVFGKANICRKLY